MAWLRARGQARGLILGYHRVGGNGADPHMLSVSLAAFEEHVLAIRQLARPVPLSELVNAVRTGTGLDRMVAVTFDDAYATTLRLVEPVLRQHGVPATIFAPTDLLGTEPWWDRLARILCVDTQLPPELVAPLGANESLRRPLDEGEREGAAQSRERAQVTLEVYGALRALSEADRCHALDVLEESVAAASCGTRELVISAEELAALDRSDLFEVGSHSVTHPVLTELPVNAQRREVEESRRDLEALLGRAIDLFSYPNGVRNPGTDAILREAGYRGACASQPGVATPHSDTLALPRFWPVDKVDHVARLVRHWL